MLNTRKLIYLLPEACLVAELLPSKKPHTFAIQSFRQINGQFMDDEEVVTENLIKLFNKLEAATYTLVLPDFLFTNTIIDVNESTEEGVRDYLLNKLLPSLGLSKETHQLETFILTQHQNKTKVQLSGLEKSILAPVFDIAQERQIEIETICPLSWTLKSAITLEPSLSAVEFGKHIYVAQHYIGVEQSVFFSTEELGNMVESIRTLRGAEPNLQTLYLLTSSETEQKMKDQLKQRLPIQQIAETETSIEGLPAHVKTAIEAAAKTLDIEDYPVPRFALEKYVEAIAPQPVAPVLTESIAEDKEPEEKVISKPLSLDDESDTDMVQDAPLPPPKPQIMSDSLDDDDTLPSTAPSLPVATTPLTAAPIAAVASTAPLAAAAPVASVAQPKLPELPELEEVESPELELDNTTFVDKDSRSAYEPDEAMPTGTDTETSSSDWLSDPENEDGETEDVEMEEDGEDTLPSSTPAAPVRQRTIIKNRNTSGSLFKMIGITLGALLVTVVVGVGIGFVLLRASDENAPINQGLAPSPQVAQTSPSPTTTASPSASVAPAAIDRATVKVLVVNATNVSGLAGKVRTTLTQAGYKNVSAANAKGTYTDEGNFVLTSAENAALVETIGTDAKLEVTAGEQAKTVEDPQSSFDFVLVLNDE